MASNEFELSDVDCSPFPKLWLSSMHGDPAQDDICPITAPPGSSARDVVEAVASGNAVVRDDDSPIGRHTPVFGGTGPKNRKPTFGQVVALVNNYLIVEADESRASVKISLLLAEVRLCYRQEGGAPTIVVFPRATGMTTENLGFSVWIVEVEGDALSARRVLLALGFAGAVQTHFDSAYEVELGTIGQGACGTVHRAHGRHDYWSGMSVGHRRQWSGAVAAKVVKVNEGKASAANQQILFAELSILVSVQKHPNVVALLGFFKMENALDEEARLAIVMEMCSGGDLFDRITKTEGSGIYSEAESFKLMKSLLAALEHVHARQVVHRDIKAENILLKANGEPVLADFGIATLTSDKQQMERRCGSPGYAAPEVLTGSRYSEKVDIFGIGVTLFFALSGRLPFSGGDIATVLRRNLRCSIKFNNHAFDTGCDHGKEFISYLMRKDPLDRPSATEALCKLARLDLGGECALPKTCRSSGPFFPESPQKGLSLEESKPPNGRLTPAKFGSNISSCSNEAERNLKPGGSAKPLSPIGRLTPKGFGSTSSSCSNETEKNLKPGGSANPLSSPLLAEAARQSAPMSLLQRRLARLAPGGNLKGDPTASSSDGATGKLTPEQSLRVPAHDFENSFSECNVRKRRFKPIGRECLGQEEDKNTKLPTVMSKYQSSDGAADDMGVSSREWGTWKSCATDSSSMVDSCSLHGSFSSRQATFEQDDDDEHRNSRRFSRHSVFNSQDGSKELCGSPRTTFHIKEEEEEQDLWPETERLTMQLPSASDLRQQQAIELEDLKLFGEKDEGNSSPKLPVPTPPPPRPVSSPTSPPHMTGRRLRRGVRSNSGPTSGTTSGNTSGTSGTTPQLAPPVLDHSLERRKEFC